MAERGADEDVVAAVDDVEQFVEVRFAGARRGGKPPADRVTMRPVEIAGARMIQSTTYDGAATTVENLETADALERVASLTGAGFKSIVVKRLDEDLVVSFSRRGRPMVTRQPPSSDRIDLAHDRSPQHAIPEDAPFLVETGIADERRRIKPTARAKFRQVQRFVELLDHTIGDLAPGTVVRAVDLGCGSGVLTLAAHHHLSTNRGLAVTTVGVDRRDDLIGRLTGSVERLGWTGIRFEVGEIADFEPGHEVDLVIALHACDTATDEAIAQAIAWKARFILAAPCCHHDVQRQLDRSTVPDSAATMLRHGIVRERLGDLITDTLRAEVLASQGYRTDIIEFVSTEHTARNLLIRAVADRPPDPGLARAVDDLAEQWGIEPLLARLVRSPHRR